MKQDELIVGRWYDFNNPTYRGKTAAKFKELSANKKYFRFSEFVGDNKHKSYNGSWSLNKCTNKLTDLTEIQPFLPENHPDKQNEWIPKVGDWVKRSWTDGDIDYFEIKSFDKDRNKIFVDYSKYYRNGKVLSNSSDETFGINGDGRVKDTKALPYEIPDDFVLPERWCIAVTHYEKDKEVFIWRKNTFLTIGFIHNDVSKTWSGFKMDGYTEITLEQFKKHVLKQKGNFILPEKWCVKLTEENVKHLEDWRNQGKNSLSAGKIYGYLHSDKIWTPCIKTGYTEITLEQFKKYVLKESCVDEVVKSIDNTGSLVYNGSFTGGKYYLGIDLDEEEKSSEIHIPELTRHNKTQVKVITNLSYPNITINLIPKESKKVNPVTIKQTKISLK